MSEAPPSKKQKVSGSVTTPFQPKHELLYGVKPSDYGAGGVVLGARCRFCLAFGRENKQSQSYWMFKAPFRPQNYRAHLTKQHPEKWALYQTLSDSEKRNFFDVPIKAVELIHFYLDSQSDELHFSIGKNIVEVIIGRILWNPEDVDSNVTRSNALAVFRFNESTKLYDVCVKQVKQYQLATRLVGRGLSFRQAALAVQDAKDVTSCVKLGNCNDLIVAKYVRIVCAVSFQNIAELLSESWAFAIAVDGSDCQSSSYIDLRVRLCSEGRLLSLHVIAVPFFGRHTGDAIYDMIETIFDVLCPDWKSKLIACSTDGAANMTGHISGLVTRLSNVALPGFVRIWCSLHQIDLVMQQIFRKVDDERFYPVLTRMISHLRRQKLLIDRLKSTCPALSGTRWISMSRVSSYLLQHRTEILEHYESLQIERRKSEPMQTFWIYLAVVNVIATEVNDTVQRLQGKQALLSQQSLEIDSLIQRIQIMSFAEIISDEPIPTHLPEDTVDSHGFRYLKTDLQGFLADQGLFVVQGIRELENEELSSILDSVAEMLSTLVVGLQHVRAERDENNNSSENEAFPTLPLEFVQMRPRDVIRLVEQHELRLASSWSRKQVESICTQHRALKKRCENQPRFKSALSRSTVTEKFHEAWEVEGMSTEYPELCAFAGGLAAILPNTASVESDFSQLKWEKDDFRHSLTDLSLEGILQCRQMLNSM